MGMMIGAPLSDLITFQATKIWCKLYVGRKIIIRDIYQEIYV